MSVFLARLIMRIQLCPQDNFWRCAANHLNIQLLIILPVYLLGQCVCRSQPVKISLVSKIDLCKLRKKRCMLTGT